MNGVVRRCTGRAMADKVISACRETQQGISMAGQLSKYLTGQQNHKTCTQAEQRRG